MPSASSVAPRAVVDRCRRPPGGDALGEHGNLIGPELVSQLRTAARVSTHVACLRLTSALPAGYVFALVDATGQVVLSAQTAGTSVRPPERGTRLERSLLDQWASRVDSIVIAGREVLPSGGVWRGSSVPPTERQGGAVPRPKPTENVAFRARFARSRDLPGFDAGRSDVDLWLRKRARELAR